MLPMAALLVGTMLGAADITAATPAPEMMPALHLHGVPLARTTPAGTLRLREPGWTLREGTQRWAARAAQSTAPASDAAATTPPPATTTAAPAAAPAEDAGDQPTAEEIQQTALMRQRRGIRDIHRPLGVATWSAMAGTVFFGTIAAINQRTLFGQGLCLNTPPPGATSAGIFGDFGCSQMGNVHELSAFITVSLYTATGIYALNMLRLDNAAQVSGHDNTALAVHKIMAYIHLAGMILQPILGIIAVNPGIVGVQYNSADPDSLDRLNNFQAAMRTIHLGVGYVTFAALTTAMALEYY